MFRKLMSTRDDHSALVLRLALGIVMFPHGAQKVLGWYGGYGLGGTLKNFTETLGIPLVFACLAIAAEFLGSIGLVVGLFGRVAALGIGCVMVVAWRMHMPNGFFMNWSGTQQGEGYEYHLLAIAIALAILFKGSGALSLDRVLSREPAPV